MAKSFGAAFKEARKLGLKKFLWNSNWYGTALAGEKSAASHGSVEKGKGQLRIAKSNGLKYEVRKSKDGFYYIWDNDLQSQVGRTFKDAKQAQDYAKSDNFKNDTSTVTVTAQRKKLDRKTPGYLPVDNVTDLVDGQGNTRVFKNIQSGQHFVVDNYGNIIGDSFDPNAGKNGFTGWVINTNSKLDLQRAGAGELWARSNQNEVNLTSRLKEWRLRLGEEGIIQDVHNGRTAAGNVISLGLNLPFHTIFGLARVAAPGNDYSTEDYLLGFNLNRSYLPLNLTAGAGDIAADYMPKGKARDFAQISGNIVGNTALGKSFTRANQSFNRQAGWRTRNMGWGKTAITNSNGKVVPSSKINDVVGAGKWLAVFNSMEPGTMSSRFKLDYNPITHNPRMRVMGTGPVRNGGQYMSNNTLLWEPLNLRVSNILNRTATPYHVVTGNLQSRNEYFDNPTANFTYENGEGNPTVMGRIKTGDFVPGTTGEFWDGTIGGNSVTVSNTDNYISPTLGGKTAGSGKNNKSNLYLKGSYRQGGRLKSRING